MKNNLALLLCTSLLFIGYCLSGCGLQNQPELPILGTINSPYTFTNQKGESVSQATFAGKVYVADFFFTSCPTICPIMKTQMARIYKALKNEDRFLLLSHTIDPEHDTVEVLKDYSDRLNVSAERWHMVTGKKSEIYDNAMHYMLAAAEDEKAPGGFIHSGSFCLVDHQSRIRGFYRGTEKEAVDRLIKDIHRLLGEVAPK